MITTTVKPTSWDSTGGPGTITEYPNGVAVDPHGLLRLLLKEDSGKSLAELRAKSEAKAHWENVRQSSPLRKISLPRLEKQVQLCLAAGRPLTEDMQVLAGLQRIRYVFVYPQSGDIVLAGPAGNWTTGDEDLLVSTETGRSVMRLDDLVVVFRRMMSAADASFGCMIVPRQESLARVQDFLKQSAGRPINADLRHAWLARLRAQLGQQDIEVYGLDPRTRAARVMVEADYRMKLVGMGLEEGVPGVPSYLAMVTIPPGGAAPPMSVLRWWFTVNYDAIMAADRGSAFAIQGQGVKVESENERLAAQGQRIHTGQSDELNRQFARNFTEHFEALAEKYPIYGELRNLFDLALVASLIRQQNLGEKVGWHMTCFGDSEAYPVALAPAPKTVESVVNCRVIHGVNIVAGISGGVRVAPASLTAQQAVKTEGDSALSQGRKAAISQPPANDIWWWD